MRNPIPKRKDRGGGERDSSEGWSGKRSKGGSGGKWQTPHQQAKAASRGSGKIEPDDMGIWATCARGVEGKATEELRVMLYECAERFYGIVPEIANHESQDDEDIEVSIQKEMASIGDSKTVPKLFSPVHLDLQCVLFFKTRSPIDPVNFVHRICEDILANPGTRKMRYINRLTPMTLIGKATEKGVENLARTVLSKHFRLNCTHIDTEVIGDQDEEVRNKVIETPSYAIRPTIRNHNTLKRDIVINKIAHLISDSHKVNLTNPEKVILVEMYQKICGMSVVGRDWDKLKRYNLAELYRLCLKDAVA